MWDGCWILFGSSAGNAHFQTSVPMEEDTTKEDGANSLIPPFPGGLPTTLTSLNFDIINLLLNLYP
jgi:hypothetical protein